MLPIRPPLPAVVAHRGFHDGDRPHENTLEAFHAAADLGVDTLELDVRRTRDGVLVVHHDPDVAGSDIARLDYAQLPPVGAGSRIPRLDEVVDLAHARDARLTVELKEAGYEREVVDVLARQLPFDQFELISFSPGSVEAVERYAPQARTGLLAPRVFPWMRESAVWPVIALLLDPLHLPARRAQRAGADFLSIDRRSVTDGMLADAASRGLDVDVWTVNEHAELARLVNDPRVHAVVTDRPDLAMQLRGQPLLGALQLQPALAA